MNMFSKVALVAGGVCTWGKDVNVDGVTSL